jgi:hypothetical protein
VYGVVGGAQPAGPHSRPRLAAVTRRECTAVNGIVKGEPSRPRQCHLSPDVTYKADRRCYTLLNKLRRNPFKLLSLRPQAILFVYDLVHSGHNDRLLNWTSLWRGQRLLITVQISIAATQDFLPSLMTETTPMSTENNDHQANSQQKKKKADDPSIPPDLGMKPVQLQRRRVWRACESCRWVCCSLWRRLPFTTFLSSQTEEDQVRWQRAYLLSMCGLEISVYLAPNQG